MTEFDYEVMQRKRIASGARHRVNGSKTKYCGLPSDHMTQAQWKKKNGEVISVNLNEPMFWGTFKDMSSDLQKEYIEKCVSRFGCNMADFARMFMVHNRTIKRHFEEIHVNMDHFKRGGRMSKESKVEFEKWMHPSSEKHVATKQTPAVKTEPAPAPDSTPKKIQVPSVGCTHMELTYRGKLDLFGLITTIHEFAADGCASVKIIMDREAAPPNE